MNTKTSPCSIREHLTFSLGTAADYAALHPFHYRGGHPGAIKRVFVARYLGPGLGGRCATTGMLAAVAVESLPALGCALRQIALPNHFTCADRSLAAAHLNRDLRTISRVVVHPIFRSTGLAVELVRHLLAHAETPFIEALAAMGRVNPFFQRAGMTPFDRPPNPDAVRLIAALERENLRPLDLADPLRLTPTPFLLAELERFSRRHDAPFPTLIAEARARLLSQPIYYLWKRDAVEPQRTQSTQRPPP